MSGTIGNQQLMLEQQRFRGEGADATRTEELSNVGKQVNGEDQKFAYERTLSWLPPDARVPSTGGFRHTTNSPPDSKLTPEPVDPDRESPKG
jgi:hypothetical protein